MSADENGGSVTPVEDVSSEIEEVVEEKGIEQTLELLQAIKETAVVGITALADGFQFADIGKLVSLYKPVSAAVEGIQEVDDELKDLNEAEAIQLGLATYGMIKAIIETVKDK